MDSQRVVNEIEEEKKGEEPREAADCFNSLDRFLL